MMKTCSKCLEIKTPEDFNRHSQTRDGLQSQCKECARAAARASSKKKYTNPCLEFQANLAQVKRAESYKRKYGWDITNYEQQLEKQGGCCAICGTSDPKRNGMFHIDHCHDTGKVRGLLCGHCNIGIGNLKDDPLLLARAIDYLLDPPHLRH